MQVTNMHAAVARRRDQLGTTSVVVELLYEGLGVADRRAGLGVFTDEGLGVVHKALGLLDEQPIQLM